MFQRMTVIPQEEYLQLAAIQAARKPMIQQMRQLTSEYEEQGQIPDPYRRLIHQAETLDAMKGLKEKMRHEIVLATPKAFQSRTRSLFQHLEPVLKLNERGEMLDKDNAIIPNSRIEDLIQYAVRDRRRNYEPTGWHSFLELLRDNNIPKYMLNRNTLEELDRKVSIATKVFPVTVKREIATPHVSRSRSRKGARNRSRAKSGSKSRSPIKQRLRRDIKKPKTLYDFVKF